MSLSNNEDGIDWSLFVSRFMVKEKKQWAMVMLWEKKKQYWQFGEIGKNNWIQSINGVGTETTSLRIK